MRSTIKAAPMAAAAACAIFTGMGVVATRFVVVEWEPATLAFYRYAIAAATILPFLAIARPLWFERRDVLPILALGAVFYGLYAWMFSAGMVYIPASRGALIVGTMPLATMVFAALLRFEAMTRLKTVGAALAFGGVAVALSERGALGAATDDAWIGDLITFASLLILSICFVFYGPYLRKYPSLTVSAWSMLAGALFLLPFAAWEGGLDSFPALSAERWAAVGFLGVFAGSLGYFLWIWALQRGTPTQMSVFITLNPMTATMFGAVVLSEEITDVFLVGLSGVVLGILVANWRPGGDPASGP